MAKVKQILIYLSLAIIFIVVAIAGTHTSPLSAAGVDIVGDSYILVEANSMKVLKAKNETEKLPVASICKLMTSLITMEYIDSGNISADDKVTVSEFAASTEGSQAFLDAGSTYTVEELLKTVIIASANDSSVALAEHIAGSESQFVKLMNSRAESLGMRDTIYENATGLNTMGQHSTAKDTAKILSVVNKFDLYHKYCKVWMDELKHPSGRVTELVNTNRLVKYYDKCISGKTGFTDEAGYCLSSVASNGDLDLIAVTLKCPKANDRFEDCVKLFNYGFANFKSKKIVDSSINLKSVNVSRGKEKYVNTHAERDFVEVIENGHDADLRIEYNYNSLVAPFSENSIAGVITIIDSNGVIVDEINIVTTNGVDIAKYGDVLDKMYDNWNLF